MTSSLPFPSRVSSDAARAAAAPATAEFSTAPGETAMTARDGERPPDFGALCDQACASLPAPAPANDPATGPAAVESSPTDTSEPAIDSNTGDDFTPVALSEAATVVAPPDMTPVNTLPTAPAPAPQTGLGAPLPASDSARTTIVDHDTTRMAPGEFSSHLALRVLRNAYSAPAIAPGTAPAATTAVPTAVVPPSNAAGTVPVVPPPAGGAAVPADAATGDPAKLPAPVPTIVPPRAVTVASAPPVAPAVSTPSESAAPSSEASTTVPTVIAAVRVPAARAPAENSSGQGAGGEATESGAGQKNSLRTAPQFVATDSEGVGTGTALHDNQMKPGSQFAPRSLPLASDAGHRAPAFGSGSDTESSFAWKGWTNGGGDRASTAAQFSRLTEQPVFPGATPASAASPAVGRAAAPAPVASPAPAYPTSEAALLAPVNAAIERLISRGQDQLSVVVRFEQGGSLSLKLTMRDGGIAAHMQTDVPGLEAALRSAWTSFAQDWNQRGVKLAAPSFGGGANADLSGGHDGHRTPQHEGQGLTGEAPLFGPQPGRRAFRTVPRGVDEPSGAAVAGKFSRAQLAQRGLSTWA